MMVESTIRYSKSGSSDIAAKMRHQTPLWLQRLKRRKTLFQSPNTSGRSRQGEPVRTIHRTASIEHPVVATRRAATTLIADNVGRYALPLIVPKDQTVQNTHDCLQKTVLNLICSLLGIPRVHTS